MRSYARTPCGSLCALHGVIIAQNDCKACMATSCAIIQEVAMHALQSFCAIITPCSTHRRTRIRSHWELMHCKLLMRDKTWCAIAHVSFDFYSRLTHMLCIWQCSVYSIVLLGLFFGLLMCPFVVLSKKQFVPFASPLQLLATTWQVRLHRVYGSHYAPS